MIASNVEMEASTMAAGFEPGPRDPQPFSVGMSLAPSFDPIDVLPPGSPQKKWTALHQRKVDAFAATPAFADIRELADDKLRHQKRIDDLIRPKAEGGHGQPELSSEVVAQRRALERVEIELARKSELKEIRGARANTVAQLERSASDWLLRGGIPHGCALEAVEDAPIGELLKKGERIADAVLRFRHRLRELGADRHRLKSAPWPSSVLKANAKALVEQWAQAAKPDFESMVEFNSPLTFKTVSLSSFVRGSEPALAFTEIVDCLGALCWLFPDQILQKINAGIDEISDDKAARSQQQREEMDAEISASVLAIERAEVACIWAAEDQNNEIIDFRAGTSPQAVLGVRLVNQPRTNGSGTNAGYAFHIIGGR